MSGQSSPDKQACLEMWRNDVPTSRLQRIAQHIVKREQIKNDMVQLEIEAAEQGLARLQLAAAELLDSDHEVSECSSPNVPASIEGGCGTNISFSTGYHPESTYMNLMRCGTPAVLSVTPLSYIADDESEAPPASRRNSCDSGSHLHDSLCYPTPPPPTPEPLQGPADLVRALDPSEFWDEEAPVEPIIYAPVPLRPLINPVALLEGHYQEPESSLESPMDQRMERISGLLGDLKKIHQDLESSRKSLKDLPTHRR